MVAREMCRRAGRYARKTFWPNVTHERLSGQTLGPTATDERLLGQALCTKDFWAADLEEILEAFAASRYFLATDCYFLWGRPLRKADPLRILKKSWIVG